MSSEEKGKMETNNLSKKIRQAAMEMRIEEISSKLVEKQAENKDINN